MRTTGPGVSIRLEMEEGWVLVANTEFRPPLSNIVVVGRCQCVSQDISMLVTCCSSTMCEHVVCVSAYRGHLMFLYL